MASDKDNETPVLHVIVVGFHHKKGCQVEYSYPPVIAGNAVDSSSLPEEWKHLPSLALPDGAHNFLKDTVFFHLPSRASPSKTVYCVSCYRQMDAKDLLNKTADITRSTVQKSVCVISRLPLYGLIKAKLELITHAYFDERDFSKVELLEQTFNNLNLSLTQSLLSGTQVFLGLSPRDAIIKFKHKLLVLFKLLLLERRVLFFGSPVETLGTTLLSVLSLFPGMLECGLDQAVSDPRHRLLSPTLGTAGLDPLEGGTGEDFVELHYHDKQPSPELAELMPHMHNAGVATCLSNQAPESPTIPRDAPLGFGADPGKEGDGRHRRASGERWKSSELKVHSPRPSCSSQDSQGSHTSAAETQAPHSPTKDASAASRISAGQTGETMPEQPSAGEGCTEDAGLAELGDPLLKRCDSLEELDSPESISRIDREDCFSWEQDRLTLALDVEAEEAASSKSAETSGEPQASPARTNSADNSRASGRQSAEPQKKGRKSSSASPKNSGSPGGKTAALKSRLTSALGKVRNKGRDTGEEEGVEMTQVIKGHVTLQQDDFGFPLAIFTKGCVCHPYLSLQFHSILSDVNVRSFVLGATNILFRQQRQVTDVIVEVGEGKLEVKDRELQRQLNLTTADLRFSQLLLRLVTQERSDTYLDGTEWEGSDEWIRAQFRAYLQSLLASLYTDDPRLTEDFGAAFITAWRTTHNCRHWLDTLPHPKMADVPPSHPCHGNLSVTDVRMRLNHSMQSTERGRKLNAAVLQTGKYVMQTGKAVGGAFSSARSAVSSWFTSIANDWKNEEEGEGEEGETEKEEEETEREKEEETESEKEKLKERERQEERQNGVCDPPAS